jgi:hypothetical protein
MMTTFCPSLPNFDKSLNRIVLGHRDFNHKAPLICATAESILFIRAYPRWERLEAE